MIWSPLFPSANLNYKIEMSESTRAAHWMDWHRHSDSHSHSLTLSQSQPRGVPTFRAALTNTQMCETWPKCNSNVKENKESEMNSVDWSAIEGNWQRTQKATVYAGLLLYTRSHTHTYTPSHTRTRKCSTVLVARGVAAMQSAQHKAFH